MSEAANSATWIRGAHCDALDRRTRILRRLPVAMRGKARLARWILGDLSRVEACEIRHREGMWIEVPGIGDSIAFFLLIDGVYEPHELEWLRRLAMPSSWVVDVGANVGALALPLAHARGDIAGVLAVEASPVLAAMLERSRLRARNERVTVVNVAAGAAEGNAWFDALSTAAFGQGHVSGQPRRDSILVPMRTIDSLVAERCVERVSVIKIDVEGYEAEVLKGAARLLRGAGPPAILFEFFGGDAGVSSERMLPQQILFEHGYRIFALEGGRRATELNAPLREGFRTLLALRRDDARLTLLGERVGPVVASGAAESPPGTDATMRVGNR